MDNILLKKDFFYKLLKLISGRIMGLLTDERLMVKIAKMHYEDDMSQKEISDVTGISRPQISRLIAAAKEFGLVRVSISNRFNNEFVFEKRLAARYGLREARVFTLPISCTEEEQKKQFSRYAAEAVSRYIKDNMIIGVMSGRTLSSIADEMPLLNRPGLEFVPMVGSFGSSDQAFLSNNVARKFAGNTGASYLVLNAPVLMQSEAASEIIRKEPSIKEVLDEARRSDMVLVGIGGVGTDATSFISGAYSKDDAENLAGLGIMGSIACTYFIGDGTVKETYLDKRTLGVKMTDLNNHCLRIAAARNIQHINVVKAALKTRLIDIFITTDQLVRKLL